MPLELNVQFDIILYAILSGIIIGFLFDTYRIFRGFKISKIIIFFEDILFCILCALLVFLFLLYTNYAFLGPYVYLFIVITFIIYIRFFSIHVRKFEMLFFNSLNKIIRITFKHIIYPIKIFLSKIEMKKWITMKKLLE